MSQVILPQADSQYELQLPPKNEIQDLGVDVERTKPHDLMDFITPALGLGLVIIAVARWLGMQLSPGAFLGFALAAFIFSVADCVRFATDVLIDKPASKWMTPISPVLQVVATICLVVFPAVIHIEDTKVISQFNDGAALFSLGLAVVISGVRTMIQVVKVHRSWKMANSRSNKYS